MYLGASNIILELKVTSILVHTCSDCGQFTLLHGMMRDNPKLLDDCGDVSNFEWSGWWFDSHKFYLYLTELH